MLLAAFAVPALGDATPGQPAASIVVHDNYFQDGGSADPNDSVIEVVEGSTVFFSYPKSEIPGSVHNVVFESGSAPASCVQTAPVSGPAPPLPEIGQPQGWAGSCQFDAIGTYTFNCGVHPMSGAVKVVASLTPTPTPTPTPSPTPTPEPPAATVDTTAVPTPAATPSPAPRAISRARIVSAVLKRSKRTVTYSGTVASGATGKVKLELTYRVGKSSKHKSAAARIHAGRFSGVVRLTAANAKRASRVTLTVAYPGDARFLPSSKLASVKISRLR